MLFDSFNEFSRAFQDCFKKYIEDMQKLHFKNTICVRFLVERRLDQKNFELLLLLKVLSEKY